MRKGHLEYYNLHAGFIEGDPLSLKDKYFKGAIRLDLIHEVNYLPKNKILKNAIELIFPKNQKVCRQPMENQQDESEVMERNVEGEEDLEKWVFEFRTDVKEWVEEKREESKQEKRNLARLAPLSSSHVRLKSETSFTLNQAADSGMVQPSEVRIDRSIEEYVEAVQRTKEFLRSKADVAEEEAARLRKRKEKEMAELMNTKSNSVEEAFSISSFWRDYFRALEQVVSRPKEKRSLEAMLESELNMLILVEYFNSVAVKIVQSYVDERAIGWNGAKKTTERFSYYQGLWIRVGEKELNQEFLVNYYLNDIFYSLSELKGHKFRVPLMSLVKYKGLKLLVMCDMPFSELDKSEVYNLIDEGFDLQLMGKLKESLEFV